MKNRMMFFVALMLTQAFALQVRAQDACQDLFAPLAIELTLTTSLKTKEFPPAAFAAYALDVLRKTTFTRDSNFNEKQVIEKGEIVLAEPLKDGWSIEFSYSKDSRGVEPVYRLEEIDLIKPNGDTTVLDKSPMTTDGLGLKDNVYPIDQLAPAIGDVKVEMPHSIQGPLLENLSKWARLSEFMKLGEVRALKTTADLKALRGKVFARSTVDYTNKVIKKQSFKFFLLGMVMYLYSQRDKITNEVILVDPWDKFKRQSDLAMSNPQMFASMQSQLQLLTDKKYKIPESTSRESFRYFDFADTLEKIDIMNRLERTAGSKVKIGLYLNGKLSPMTLKDIHMDAVDVLEESDAIVLYFPKTERMLILSGSWMKFEMSADLIVPYALSWNGSIEGNIYNDLKEKFKAMKKDR